MEETGRVLSLSRSLGDSGFRLSDPFAKGACPVFEITTSFSPGLFKSEWWEGVWRFISWIS